MNRWKRHFLTLLAAVLFGAYQLPAAAAISIVVAENFYGEMVKAIGGDQVSVSSILQNPTQDPHLFTSSPQVAKQVADADIVIYNGAHYDDWMARLLSVPSKKPRQVLVIAQIIAAKPNQNPHLWYIPTTMARYAQQLLSVLIQQDPTHRLLYQQRFNAQMIKQNALEQEVTALKAKVAGMPVTATEPVFNLMMTALGLQIHNIEFQESIENETSPSPSLVRAMLQDLTERRVRVLIYNNQVSSLFLEQIKATAEQNKIPVVGVSETQPPNMTYYQWLQQQLTALSRALLS